MDTASQTNKKKILVIDGLSHEGIELLENRADIEFEILMNPSEEDIIQNKWYLKLFYQVFYPYRVPIIYKKVFKKPVK